MTRWSRVRRASLWIAVLAAVAGLLLPFARASIVAGAALLVVALVAGQTIAWAGALRSPETSQYARALERHEEPTERPEDLEALERTLGWKWYSQRDFEHRVKPLLERLLVYKLMSSRGLERPGLGERLELPEPLALDEPSRSAERWADTTSIGRLLDRIES